MTGTLIDRILNGGLQHDKTAYAALVYFVFANQQHPNIDSGTIHSPLLHGKSWVCSEVPNGLNFCPEWREQNRSGE